MEQTKTTQIGSLHQPERKPGESFEEYKARRKLSNDSVKRYAKYGVSRARVTIGSKSHRTPCIPPWFNEDLGIWM